MAAALEAECNSLHYMDEETEPVEGIDADEIDQNAIDHYLHAEVLLPIAGEMKTGTLMHRKRDKDGNLIGKSTMNHIKDTQV
jgi:hypothetical protein